VSVNQNIAAKIAARIRVQVTRAAGRGVQAASRFLAGRIKEALSVPAPRRAVRASPLPGQKRGGILYYRATTPAIPGAPPRKLSGRLRTSVVATTLSPTAAAVGANARANPSRAYPRGFNYPKYHETGDQNRGGGALGEGPHPFIAPTATKYRRELAAIVGKPIKLALKRR
jgi:hypothetical protein